MNLGKLSTCKFWSDSWINFIYCYKHSCNPMKPCILLVLWYVMAKWNELLVRDAEIKTTLHSAGDLTLRWLWSTTMVHKSTFLIFTQLKLKQLLSFSVHMKQIHFYQSLNINIVRLVRRNFFLLIISKIKWYKILTTLTIYSYFFKHYMSL